MKASDITSVASPLASTAGGAIGNMVLPGVGGILGSAAGSAIGDAAGSAGKALDAYYSIPTGPGATIEGGSVGSGSDFNVKENAMSLASSFQNLAMKGMQQLKPASGTGKRFGRE